MTEWGARVTPENAWRDYPRPRLIRGDWQNLNGLWDYAITPDESMNPPAAWIGQILVPYPLESSLSGVGRLLAPSETLWYRRRVATPPLADGARRILRFQGVDWDAKVWVNGMEVGGNQGMNRRWSCDLTDASRGRTESEIVVRVRDATEGKQPRGKQSLDPKGCFYTRISGIWRTVWMETVPEQHVTEIRTESLPDLAGITVRIEANRKGLPISVRLLDAGNPVAETTGTTGQELTLRPPQPNRWSPSSPHLYDLVVSLTNGETVRGYTAIRTCGVIPDAHGTPRLHLNGEPLFQYGPLDQGWWPESLLTPPSHEAQTWEIAWLKRAGCNMIRKHLKVEDDLYYRACDELGMIVWQDFPFPGDRKNQDARNIFRNESLSIIDQLRDFPCITMWIVFNEMWEQFDEAGTREVTTLVKSTDPSRVVNSASGWMDYGTGDVVDAHRYPGPGIPALDPKRAVLLGEFGGQGLAVPGHMWKQESWRYKDSPDPERLAKAYAGFMEKLDPLVTRGLSGAVYTQTSDVEIEKNGLLTYDHKVHKIAAERLAAMHAPLFRKRPPFRVLAATSELKPVPWKFTTGSAPDGWMMPDFNDTTWIESPGGFGAVSSKYTSGMTRIRTPWITPEIRLRRTFTFNGLPPVRPALVIYADHKAQVWLNGTPLGPEIERSNAGSYMIVPLDSLPFAEGTNTLAIHCRRQQEDNQYIDAGIIDLGEPAQP